MGPLVGDLYSGKPGAPPDPGVSATPAPRLQRDRNAEKNLLPGGRQNPSFMCTTNAFGTMRHHDCGPPHPLHDNFASSSTYKPMLFLALSGLPFSFRTVNLKNGVQKEAAPLAINRYGQVPVLRHGELTLVMSSAILDYLARTTGHFEPRHRAAPPAGPRMALLGERRHHQRGARPAISPRFPSRRVAGHP